MDFVDLFIFICIIYFFLFVIAALFSTAGLYAFRNLIEPLLFLLVCRNLKIHYLALDRIIYYMINIAVLLTVFGVYQCIFLGDDFLIDLGYNTRDGNKSLLANSYYFAAGIFQRNVSTFSSPNTLGVYLTFIIILLNYHKGLFSKFRYAIFNIILVIGLLLTFSRSAILGLFLVYLFVNQRNILYIFLIGFASIFSMYVFLPEYFFSLFRFFELMRTFKDPSLVGHYDSLVDAIEMIKNNFFFGMGIGKVGPRAVNYTNAFIDIENSFFCLFLEVGVLGLILYFSIFIKPLLNKITFLIFLSMVPALMFLPTIYELEVMIIIYAMIGLITNKNILESKNAKTVLIKDEKPRWQ